MNPDALIILSGGIVPQEQGGQESWRSTTYDESDAFGALGGRDRIEAGAALARRYPDAVLVTTSHRLGRVRPSLAEIYARELEELGVAKERIVQEEGSSTTQTAIAEAFRLAREKGWKRIFFVSSGFHIPRIEAFCARADKGATAFAAIASEPVLAEEDPAFSARFAAVEASPAYRKRLESEANGLEALKNGTYTPAAAEDKRERAV